MDIRELNLLMKDAASPCDACPNRKLCASKEVSCCAYHYYLRAKANSDAKKRYEKLSHHRHPTSRWYRYTHADEADSQRHMNAPYCPNCHGVDADEAA